MVEAESHLSRAASAGPTSRPADFRAVWEQKPALRAVYADLYRQIARRCRPGRTLEIGGGSGNLKAFAPDVISTDIQWAPWLDAAADAHQLPFAAGSFANVVLFDVLHHLERPRRVLVEAARVLTPGGRLVMVEPAITPLSFVFYKLFHREPVDMAVDPLADGALTPGRDPYLSNQAVPTLLFGRFGRALAGAVPTLELGERRSISLWAYPLSGGFQRWSLLPAAAAPALLAIEHALEPLLGRLIGFRLLVVLERR